MERIHARLFATPFRRTCLVVYCAVSSLFVIFVSTSALNSANFRYQLKIPWHYMEAEIDYSCVLLSYSHGGPGDEKPFRYQFGKTEMDVEATFEEKSIMKRLSRCQLWGHWSCLGFQYLEQPVIMCGSTRWVAVSSDMLAFALFFPVLMSVSLSKMRGCFATRRKA